MDGKRYPFEATIEQSPAAFRNFKRNVYIGAGNNRGTAQGFFDGALSDVRLFCKATGSVIVS